MLATLGEDPTYEVLFGSALMTGRMVAGYVMMGGVFMLLWFSTTFSGVAAIVRNILG